MFFSSTQDLLDHIISSKISKEVVDDICAGDVNKILKPSLANLQGPSDLQDCLKAAKRIVMAIKNNETIGIVTDYDVDGITSHAIIFNSLIRYFGVQKDKIKSFIGHRIRDGYGLSAGVVDAVLAQDCKPQLIITADCGSSDEARIKKLLDIDVIVTDHHAIPDEGVPASAYATINPTRDDCIYKDQSIAGCMVAWLLMCQVRSLLMADELLPKTAPKLTKLLDFVALGTIADAVSMLSPTNRAVVTFGLKILNKIERPCWQALTQLLNRQSFNVEDLGFQIGPRINARGRMADPFAALHFLLAENVEVAMKNLLTLDEDNKDRKSCEKQMLTTAIEQIDQQIDANTASIVVAHEEFHVGVQGIVASRLVELYGKPTIVLSPAEDEKYLSGSARTIDRVHIRDVLQKINDKNPAIFKSFGGHKGAAGLKIEKKHAKVFVSEFERCVKEIIGDEILRAQVLFDAKIDENCLSLELYDALQGLQPFGREFEQPVFFGEFEIMDLRLVGQEGAHMSLVLGMGRKNFRAIWFNFKNKIKNYLDIGDKVGCIYSVGVNEFRDLRSVQLMVKCADKVN